MAQLLADLTRLHGDVAKHIVGSVVVDDVHMTDGQLLAKRGSSSIEGCVTGGGGGACTAAREPRRDGGLTRPASFQTPRAGRRRARPQQPERGRERCRGQLVTPV